MTSPSKQIFVFGSNLAGRHGKGSALEAHAKHGARWGDGFGLQGNSYAIPTKDFDLRVLPLDQIKFYVDQFLHFASRRPDLQFNVVAIGTGNSRYSHEQMAPLFKGATENVILPQEWQVLLAK